MTALSDEDRYSKYVEWCRSLRIEPAPAWQSSRMVNSVMTQVDWDALRVRPRSIDGPSREPQGQELNIKH